MINDYDNDVQQTDDNGDTQEVIDNSDFLIFNQDIMLHTLGC